MTFAPTATCANAQFEPDHASRSAAILLTANAMARQLNEYRQAGCNGHVLKPIDASDLIGPMSRVLAEGDEVSPSEAVVLKTFLCRA